MRLFIRARYYLYRMGEAGWRSTTQKLIAKIAPYFWWPVYVSGGFRGLRRRSHNIAFARVQKLGSRIASFLEAQVVLRPIYRDESRQRALLALSRTWTVLGYGKAEIPTGIGWLTDPIHEYTWPSVYFPFVDYVCCEQVCDVKIAWELSRLQFLPWLAEGALLNEDLSDECREQFISIVEDWIQANPPGFGVNWTCAMEVAIRAINLMTSFALFSSKLDERVCALLRSSLEDHFTFLRRFPETSDVTGNHYLCDLMGEVAIASLFDNEDIFNQLANRFIDECDAQFEPDGVHLERSLVYHRLCMDVLTLGGAFIHARNPQMSASLTSVFNRALNFAKSVADSRGWLPIFGDADGGMVLHLQSEARDISDLCSLQSGADHRTFAAWLRGIAGDGQYLRNCSSEIIGPGPHGGFIGLKVGQMSLSMRVGDQGLRGRAPHDHDDATSIWAEFSGNDFIIDRGCHSYTLNSSRRLHDISSSSHNVLKAANYERYLGREGSIHLTMRGAPVCSEAFITQVGNANVIVAQINSAGKMGAVHRIVRVDKGDSLSFEVIDSCVFNDQLVLSWHFAPGFQVQPIGKACFEIRNTTIDAYLEFRGEQYEGFEIFDYSFAPNYGANSMCLGIRAFIGGSGHREIISRFEVRSVIN